MWASQIERRIGGGLGGSQTHVTLPALLAHPWRTTNQESSLEPKCPEIYWGFIT